MFSVISLIFRYLFILLIYLFMFGIIRMIYLDIRTMGNTIRDDITYLKLINRKESIPYKIKEAYTLESDVSIGRDNNNDIVLKDPYISKNHAKIIIDEGQYFLEDLGSANGTYLNGERIMDVSKLDNGDIIKLGQIDFLFVGHD